MVSRHGGGTVIVMHDVTELRRLETVRKDFIGPTTATDLWSALAELREPGSVPPSCDGDICG